MSAQMDEWINKWISERVYELMDNWKLISNEGMNQWGNKSMNNQWLNWLTS